MRGIREHAAPPLGEAGVLRTARRLTGEWLRSSYGLPVVVCLVATAAVGHLAGKDSLGEALALASIGAVVSVPLMFLAALCVAPAVLLRESRQELVECRRRLANGATRLAEARARLRDWAAYFDALVRRNADDADPVFAAIDRCSDEVSGILGAHAAAAVTRYMGHIGLVQTAHLDRDGDTVHRIIGQFRGLAGLATYLADLATNLSADDVRPEFSGFQGTVPR